MNNTKKLKANFVLVMFLIGLFSSCSEAPKEQMSLSNNSSAEVDSVAVVVSPGSLGTGGSYTIGSAQNATVEDWLAYHETMPDPIYLSNDDKETNDQINDLSGKIHGSINELLKSVVAVTVLDAEAVDRYLDKGMVSDVIISSGGSCNETELNSIVSEKGQNILSFSQSMITPLFPNTMSSEQLFTLLDVGNVISFEVTSSGACKLQVVIVFSSVETHLKYAEVITSQL
jgi:hypothetical protein